MRFTLLEPTQKQRSIATPVLMDVDPKKYNEHHFGLSALRWQFLRGKSFWVTGAGSGYGRAISIALAAAGAEVYLTGRNREKLNETKNEIKRFNIDASLCHVLPCDLRNESEIIVAADEIKAQSMYLLGLVHAAALPSLGTKRELAQESITRWRDMVSVNVTAAWLMLRELFPHMEITSHARAVLLTSQAGWAFTPGFGPYNATKAALNNLGASLAEEYKASSRSDVQINILDPGEAKSEMNTQSSVSPFMAVSMTLLLLSHPDGGPNGKFFHRDGRHLEFCDSRPYGKSLL